MAEINEELHELTVADVAYRTRLTKKYVNRRPWEYPDMKKIVSYIPGTVIEFYANEGDTVKEGEPIMLFEAMKMQTKVYMPYDGVIAKICVALGERYPKEHVLIEIQ